MKFFKWIRDNLFYIIIGTFLFLYALSLVFSLLWAFSVTIKPYSEYVMTPLKLPKKLDFSYWSAVITDFRIPRSEATGFVYVEEMFLNSVIYSFVCAFTGTFLQCVAAYLTAKYRFRFGKVVYATVIFTMILPIVGSLPSEINMLKSIGLFNTIFGIIVLKANCLGVYFLVFYASWKGISWSYAESAFIDGAGHFAIFFRIMMPLISATFLAVFLLNFINYWNDYQGPMIYWPSHPTVAYGLFYKKTVQTGSFSKEPMQITGCMLLTVPIIIIFVIFQKRLMGNLTIGGLKG